MRILITGATGFIGSALAAALRRNGHDVVPCVHRGGDSHLTGDTRIVTVDYMRDLAAEAWLPRLAGVDVVINAVGILRESARATFAELHHLAPRALFHACEQSGVRRVIQLSALGADKGAISRYHRSKRAADDYLRAGGLDWTIVQPSVVFGPYGASTQLFLRLASLPVIPLAGRGDQRLQPIHIDDLVALVVHLVQRRLALRQTVRAVGPQALSLRAMLVIYRHSLGLGKARLLPVPLALIRLGAKAGDVLKSGALDSETLGMLLHGNTGPVTDAQNILGYPPRAPKDFIQPNEAASLRARAVWSWLRPALVASIAVVWLAAGVVSWTVGRASALALLMALGLPAGVAAVAFAGACGVNVVFGAATLLAPGPVLWRLQLMVMAFYTLALSWVAPALWADPFGALVKNLPLALILLGLLTLST
jgi:uncharacterized protein YbjT (DUF2867 family)